MGSNKPELVITRIFDAPRSLVFQAWVDPKHLRQWSAPHGYELSHCEGEARPGGAWRCCMRSSDGKELWLGGVYRKVVENELIEQTHVWDEDGDEKIVTVRFEDEGRKTRMTMRQGGQGLGSGRPPGREDPDRDGQVQRGAGEGRRDARGRGAPTHVERNPRPLLADGALLGRLRRIFVETVHAFYAERAAKEGISGAKTGAVTVVQRTSSDLRLNPHLHLVALDGTYHEQGAEPSSPGKRSAT